jgi:hypothetical protein
MGQQDCFYTSYLTVMHCHPLYVSVAIILTIVFTIHKISREHETILPQTYIGRHPGGCIGSVGSKLIMVLPSSWFGSCVLGSIRPSFFLLPLTQDEKLGVPIHKKD